MIGLRFGLLTATGPEQRGHEGRKGRYVPVRCDCGAEKYARLDHLKAGRVISCGCEHARRSSARTSKLHEANTRHGLSGTPTHNSWLAMKQRCLNPKNRHYAYYGGRGIKVHEPWQTSFDAFLADVGEAPEGHTLDRIDSDGHYEPGNVRWATRMEQQNNLRRNKWLTHDGRTMTVSQWSRAIGIHRNTIDMRLAAGWPIEKVLSSDRFENRDGLALGVAARQAKRAQRG